jgi:hypothetical protein
MSAENIRNSIERTISFLEANPTKAIHKDPPVTAALESGLKFRVKGRNGEESITDMPPSIGGEGSAPSQLRARLIFVDWFSWMNQ